MFDSNRFELTLFQILFVSNVLVSSQVVPVIINLSLSEIKKNVTIFSLLECLYTQCVVSIHVTWLLLMLMQTIKIKVLFFLIFNEGCLLLTFKNRNNLHNFYFISHGVVSGSDITACNKIDKPLASGLQVLSTKYS